MTGRHRAVETPTARPKWRPAAFSAAATAAIAALFQPVPALAAPTVPQAPAPAVPDVGARPVPLGTLAMPGQPSTTTATTRPALNGVANSPVLQRIEKGRAEISTLGDELIAVGQERDLVRSQHAAAQVKYQQTVAILEQTRSAAANAAAQSMREAAAAPPGTYASGLAGLEDLARLQHGSGDSQAAVARQLEAAQLAVQIAMGEVATAEQRYNELVTKYDTLNAQLAKKQSAQEAYELKHAEELSAAETTETAADAALGAEYLAGAEAGRGADPRAVQALEYALAQRGDPYVWSEEGPDQYDCSGLMYAAYRNVGFPLMRVSRDQYWQTRNKVVDRYSLLPGDLLFFSHSSSWRGIHHVAMYAGNGLMVEAPRTGLNVRLVPVRWTRLFQATRVFGSVEGTTETPDLGTPDPDEPATNNPTSPTTGPTSSPTPSPTTSSPSPSPSPTTSSPSPSPSPTTSSPSPSPTPTTSSPSPTPTTTSPSPTPTPAPTTSTAEPDPTGEADSPSPSDSAGESSSSSSSSSSSAAASASSSADS